MTVNNLIYKLAKYFSWLYFRHWERWELLIIVLISLALLLFIIWQQRKATTRRVYVNQVRDRSPIIGVKLADNRSRHEIENLKKDGSASFPKKYAKLKKTKEQLHKLNEQVQQLQYEINKHKKTEVRLQNQVKELKAANEKLRQNTAVSNRVEQSKKQQPKQSIIEVPGVKEHPENKSVKSNTVKKRVRQQLGDLKAAQKPSKSKISRQKQPGRIVREKTEQVKVSRELREQPLDVDKLKAMAELAKRIQKRSQNG